MKPKSAHLPFTLSFLLLALLFGTPGLAQKLGSPRDGTEVLKRVKLLVDNAGLFDPARVAREFPGDTAAIEEEVVQKGVCRQGVQRAFKSTRWAFTSWFHNLATGQIHLSYNAMSPLGRPGVLGDAAGFFQLTDAEFCSDLMSLPRERSALLRFDNFPGYSCLTLEQVSAVFPVTDDHATDGGGIYTYEPPARLDFGTRVTATFGSPRCMELFAVEQRQEWGTRYVNAKARFRQCTDAADRKVRAARPPLAAGDGHIRDLMSESSAAACGGFGRYYRLAGLRSGLERPTNYSGGPSL